MGPAGPAGCGSLIVVLLIVKIWLLSATLESYLAGHREAAVSGAIISGMLFAACLGLYVFVDRIDSEVRGSDRSHDRLGSD